MKAFRFLAEYPFAGSDQSSIRAEMRRYVHEAHAIYYEVRSAEIVIARILGPGQDPLEEL